VNAFWVVCLGYFAVLAHQRRLRLGEWIWVSLAVGLGVLTKGTFYAYALPFLAWILVSVIRKEGFLPAIKFAFLGLAVVVLLNGGMWARNLQTYGFPMGPRDSVGNLANQSHTPAAILSNIIRNAAVHLGTPSGSINRGLVRSIAWIHEKMNQDLLDPATTLNDNEFTLRFSLHEDFAGNPVHFVGLLIGLVLAPFLLSRQGSPAGSQAGNRGQGLLYAGLVLSTFVLFSALYKWQAFSSRLQVPFFVIASPLVGILFECPKRVSVRTVMAGIFVLTGLPYLLLNPSRALLPGILDVPSLFTTPRPELMFVNSPEVSRGYLRAIGFVHTTGCSSIGLIIDSIDREYPFWALLSPSGREARIEHLEVDAPLDRYAPVDFEPCMVICTICYTGDQRGKYLRVTHFHGPVKLFVPPEPAP
jgi:hypothetical protein